jgi:hypothetical protein
MESCCKATKGGQQILEENVVVWILQDFAQFNKGGAHYFIFSLSICAFFDSNTLKTSIISSIKILSEKSLDLFLRKY